MRALGARQIQARQAPKHNGAFSIDEDLTDRLALEQSNCPRDSLAILQIQRMPAAHAPASLAKCSICASYKTGCGSNKR